MPQLPDRDRRPVVILGCGYTGKRVALRFLERGFAVIATGRDPGVLEDVASLGATVRPFDSAKPEPVEIPRGSLVLHSIPEHTPEILACLTEQPARLVYLSTTAVYGSIRDVDEHTQPDPNTESAKLRVIAENEVRAGPWSSLVLRPAAIYGPGRGAHVSIQSGRFQLAGRGDNFVSRIHADDLAAHVEAGLLSDVTGAWPVADDLPCTSREIAEFCARLLHLEVPAAAAPDTLHETRRADRRVDGRAIRAKLGITLRYPTYRQGIPASL